MRRSLIPLAIALLSVGALAQGWQAAISIGAAAAHFRRQQPRTAQPTLKVAASFVHRSPFRYNDLAGTEMITNGGKPHMPGSVQSFFTKKTAKPKKSAHKTKPLTAVSRNSFEAAGRIAQNKPWTLPANATLFVVPEPENFTVPGVPNLPAPLVVANPARSKRQPGKPKSAQAKPVVAKKTEPKPLAHTAGKNSVTESSPVQSKVGQKNAATKIEIVDPSTRLTTPVSVVPDKFALIIGNADSRIEGAALPYAPDDSQLIRDTLINSAGYSETNIESITNGTAAQIAAAAKTLALRVPDKATVLIYFTGVGENIEGKDYLAGIDTPSDDAMGTMLAKDDLFKPFLTRGARIFAFFQSNRPVRNGLFFGSEEVSEGSIAQMQATLPGKKIYSTVSNGKQVGLFTSSVVTTLKDIHSNQTAIVAFGWQVYYNLRRNGTGEALGSSAQSPSLPVLTNMAADARF